MKFFGTISLKSPQLILRLLLATRDIEIVQFTVQTAAFPPSCTLARKVILTFNHVRNNYPHQQCERFFVAAASFIARSGMHWITVRHCYTKLGNNTIRTCSASIFQNAQHRRTVFYFSLFRYTRNLFIHFNSLARNEIIPRNFQDDKNSQNATKMK